VIATATLPARRLGVWETPPASRRPSIGQIPVAPGPTGARQAPIRADEGPVVVDVILGRPSGDSWTPQMLR